jgi:hypothetical protein
MTRHKGNVKLSWLDVTRNYPFMQLAIRRYFLDKGFITGVTVIKQEDMEDVVIKTWEADYSKRAFIAAVMKNKGASRALKEPLLVKKLFGGFI